jgi:hypothetical protein
MTAITDFAMMLLPYMIGFVVICVVVIIVLKSKKNNLR